MVWCSGLWQGEVAAAADSRSINALLLLLLHHLSNLSAVALVPTAAFTLSIAVFFTGCSQLYHLLPINVAHPSSLLHSHCHRSTVTQQGQLGVEEQRWEDAAGMVQVNVGQKVTPLNL